MASRARARIIRAGPSDRRPQRVDLAAAGGFQLLELQLAACGRAASPGWRSAGRPRADVELDQLDARHRAQQIFRGLHHAADSRMPVQRHPLSTRCQEGRSSRDACRNRMNGVMSNGFSPVARSNVGSMFSVNCTKQLGHHDSTSPVLDRASLSMVLPANRDDVSASPVAQLDHAAAMARPAHHFVAGAERIHDVQTQQRNVRRLEHVAPGVEDHVGQFAAVGGRPPVGLCPRRSSASSLSCRCDSTPTSSLILRKFCTPAWRRSSRLGPPGHGKPRHREQKARVDAVVAGLDALAAQHAGLGPFLGLRPGPGPSATMSSTPDTTAWGSASPSPAGPVIGQAVKHAPHLVQASSISSTRPARAASNPVFSMTSNSSFGGMVGAFRAG